jgi:SNF2 family DNA or RNA helicase
VKLISHFRKENLIMKMTFRNGAFELECTYQEYQGQYGGIIKSAQFIWNRGRGNVWWTKFRNNAARLREFADDRALAELKDIKLKTVAESMAESKAVDSDLEVPCPAGLKYYGYQKAGVAFMLGRTVILLADEMGVGKTIQVVGLINLDQNTRRILVICPASLKLNWKRELERWLTRPLTVGIADSKLPFPRTDIVIVNYDILSKFRSELRSTEWDLRVADEAHYIRNPKTKRCGEILGRWNVKTRDWEVPPIPAKKRVFLTGTPIVNRPRELWPICKAADPHGLGRSWKYFRQRYCDLKHNGWGWDDSGASNLEELQERLRSTFMIRRMKADVLTELPEKVRQVIELPSNGAVAVILEEMRAWSEVEGRLDDLRAAVRQAELTHNQEEFRGAVEKLRAAEFVAFSEMSKFRHKTAIAKLPQVVAHVRECLEEGHKIVVFAHHTDVIEALMREFDSLGVVKVTGADSMVARDNAVQRFQTDPTCRVFIGNIQAAGVGLTLTSSSHVIFAELDWVPGNITQAEDRCHRIGQKDSVLVQHLVFEGSLDAKMARTIVSKQEVINRGLDSLVDGVKGARIDGVDGPQNSVTEFVEPVVEAKPVEPRPEDDEQAKLQARIAELQSKIAAKEAEIKKMKEISEEEIDLLQKALMYVAGNCDGACRKDDVGFNGTDAAFGRSLALQSRWSQKQAEFAKKMLRKYVRQIPEGIYKEIYGG